MPEDTFCFAIERVSQPRLVLKNQYNHFDFAKDLKLICIRLGVMDIHASILVHHKTYAKRHSLHEKYVAYTKFLKTKVSGIL